MANDSTFSAPDIDSTMHRQNAVDTGLNPILKGNFSRQVILTNESATLSAGAQFAAFLMLQLKSDQKNSQHNNGLVIYLHGDLGAGKTTFTRGFIQGLGYIGTVKSPTYTLVEPYVFSSYQLYHFDLYRFNDAQEWESSGFRDYFNIDSICLIEWPEKAVDILPNADIHVHLMYDVTQRKIQFSTDDPLNQGNSSNARRFNLTNLTFYFDDH